MENPIQKANEFLKSLEYIFKNKELAGGSKSSITDAIEKITQIKKNLENIHNNAVSLDYNINEKNLIDNLNYWKSFPSGKIAGQQIEKLINRSETLKAIYQKGIDIPNIYKFDDFEIQLSTTLAEFFFNDPVLFSQFKRILRNDGNILNAVTGNYINGIRFLNKLMNLKVINSFSVEKIEKDRKSWVPVKDYDNFKRLCEKFPVIPIRFNISFNGTQYKDLINGHWFNAYTYNIIFEHLKRNEFDYEIYTRVAYQTPKEIHNTAGDFDIIAMEGQRILLVECKSGILKEGTDEIEKVINKTEILRKVFDAIGKRKYEYNFMFVHNPNIDTTGISGKLTSASIDVVKINNVRAAIEKTFSK